jgi:hypothetical protein
MRNKTRYARKLETPEMVAAAMSEPEPHVEPKLEPAPDSPAALAEKIEAQQLEHEIRVERADEAADRLRDQLKALAQSEQAIRQHQAAQMAATQRPQTREQLLEQWRREGVSEANIDFLQGHPEMIDGWQLTVHSANRATQEGHTPDTDEHREATKRIFHKYISAGEKIAATGHDPSLDPTPEFFKAQPPAISAPRQPPSRSSHYSAPVSREGSPGNYSSDDNPRSVRLSPDQLEAARVSGVTPTEYAKQLVRMRRMQASGETQP